MPTINFHNPGSEEFKACFGIEYDETRSEGSENAGKAAIDPLTRFLIVGLGGQGVSTVDRLKRMTRKEYADIHAENCRVLFAALDTDRDQLENTCLEPGTETFHIPIRPGLMERLAEPSRDRFMRSWLNPRFRFYFTPFGAGQNRHAGKAIFYDEYNGSSTAESIEQFLRRRFRQLTPGSAPVRVFVVTGLMGGTGSGMLIELTQMIRRAFRREYPDNTDLMRIGAFLYLPDTMEHYFMPPQRHSIYANAYAALKEVDYYHSAAQRTFGTDFLTARGCDRALEISDRTPLFDVVQLISGVNTANRSKDRNKQAQQTVSEAILNLIAKKSARVGWDISFPEDIEQAQRWNVLFQCYDAEGEERPGVCADDTFDYMSVGTASISIPEYRIRMYLASRALRTVLGKDGGFETNAEYVPFCDEPAFTESEASGQNNSLELLTPEAVMWMLRGFCELEWRDDVSLEELCDEHVDYGEHLKARNGQIRYYDIVRNAAEQTAAFMDEQFQDTKQAMLRFLRENGPKSLVLLYHGVGPNGRFPLGVSIRDRIEQYAESRFIELPAKREYEAARMKAGSLLQSPLLRLIRTRRDAEKNELCRAVLEKEREELAKMASVDVFGPGGFYQKRYLEPLSRFLEQVEAFAKSLDVLSDAYTLHGKEFEAFLDGDHFAEPDGTSANALSDEWGMHWARDMIWQQANRIDFGALQHAIMDSFAKEPDRWTAYDPRTPEYSPRNEMDRILEQQGVTEKAGGITLNDWMTYRIRQDPNWQEWLQSVLARGLSLAEPALPINSVLVGQTGLVKTVLVPSTLTHCGGVGAMLLQALRTYCSAFNVNLTETTLENRITCYCARYALPLYALRDLMQWENAYESTSLQFLHSNESGTGMYDPELGLEWKDYPSLCLARDARLPDMKGRISREGEFLLQKLDPLFRRMQDLGLMECIAAQRNNGVPYYSFRCYLMTKPGWDWVTFDREAYLQTPDAKDADGSPKGGKTLVAYLAQQNGGSLNDPDVTAEICFGNGQQSFTDECTSKEMAEERAKRVVRRNVNLFICMKQTVLTATRLLEK